jgi:DNA-binding transcriptional regulator of glucitol operon
MTLPGRYAGLVRRFAFTPRWMTWHVLMAVAVVTCVLLADWQWVRAETTGSLQNLAYALQWPLFAVFFAVMWWRMLRLESRRLDEIEAEQAESGEIGEGEREATEQAAAEPAREPATDATGAPSASGSARPAEAVVDDEDPELAAYNRMLRALARADEQVAQR